MQNGESKGWTFKRLLLVIIILFVILGVMKYRGADKVPIQASDWYEPIQGTKWDEATKEAYQELQIITTGPGTDGQFFKHIFVFTKVVGDERLAEIGASYQAQFPQDIIFVYFCDNKEKAPGKIPDIQKASEWEHVPFTYVSNPFTSVKDVIDQRPLLAEQKKVGPPFQGETNSQKEFANSFYQLNKTKGVLAVNVYGKRNYFIEVKIDKKTCNQFLANHTQAEKIVSSWYKDFQKFTKRERGDMIYVLLQIICEGDTIISADFLGITFN